MPVDPEDPLLLEAILDVLANDRTPGVFRYGFVPEEQGWLWLQVGITPEGVAVWRKLGT